jgi:hypothetical protein
MFEDMKARRIVPRRSLGLSAIADMRGAAQRIVGDAVTANRTDDAAPSESS